MKTLVRTCLASALFAVGVVFVAGIWLLYSSWGLPNVDSLRAYAPSDDTIVPGTECLGPVFALPTSEMRGLYPLLDTTSEHIPEHVARTMQCDRQQSNFVRQLNEMRLAMQIKWRFTAEEQKTIFLNRIYFGDGQTGAAQAAKHYFNLPPGELPTADSALLIGLLRNPSYYSPYRHPDRALARRNTVIENARRRGILSPEAASASEAKPLGVD